MAKQLKSSPNQSSLFRREIPRMPEGYYTPSPNPNLKRFVEEHAKPYDPATDDYNVPPFDQPITTTKATAIYNMHTYWSKKPHDAIRQYICHYTQPGDLVMDPFCGSGGTALAALIEERAAVAIDLSPAATFITKNYCSPVDVQELLLAFEELKTKIKPEMDWLYETRCDRCDGKAITTYVVYSYVFQCPRCLNKIPLFDCKEAKNDLGKVINICPICYERGITEEISTRNCLRFDPVPVEVSYLCLEGCKPQRGERFHNDKNSKKKDYFQKFDLGKLQEIEGRSIPYWVPSLPMIKGYETTVKRNLEKQGISLVTDLYTHRNLWALAKILNELRTEGNSRLADALLFDLTSNLLKASKMMAHNNDGIGRIQKGTYYLPQIEHDINVWRFMEDTINDLIAGYQEISYNNPELVISTSDARKLEIPSNSIDYIFTDPPYGGNVQYGELNYVWEAWLGFDTKWHDSEIVVNETRGFSYSDWQAGMTQAMSECFRTLKPGHWISLCYHDTSEGTWQFVQDMMIQIGFIPENTDKTLFIDTSTKTTNQYFAEKVTKRDLVINFRKPRPGEVSASIIISGEEDEVSFQDKARAILTESLERHPGATSDRLYDDLVSRMVRRGEFQRHNFDELLRSVSEESNGRWYLLETSGQVDEAESKKESGAARRLEHFMVQHLKGAHGELGVHYSDLFEQYLPIADKPRRALIEWLPEFFFKTEEGMWRPPKDDEERQAKAGLRASGVLRRIKRFASALAEGVPPAQRDTPGNAATLADWIYQCRRAGLYDLGRILYEKGGLRFDGLHEDLQLQVEEDYQICVRRSEKKEDKTKRKSKKSGQLELGLESEEE